MKRIFTLLFVTLCLFANAFSQSASYDEFPIKVSYGLTSSTVMSQYCWDSPVYSFAEAVDGVRITFIENVNGESYAGYPAVAIAELTFFDRSYSTIPYSVSNVKYNSLESGSSIGAICDNDWASSYSSALSKADITPDNYVYIDVKFSAPVSSFCITMVARDTYLAPSSIILTSTGVNYDGSIDNGEGNGGDGNGEDNLGGNTSDEDINYQPVDVTNDSTYFVYLRNGGVDAYQKVLLDGDAYIENNSLYVTLKGAEETIVYDETEYDSCSWVCPQLPSMLTYKFNNKYNPNLNVDAIADTVRNIMDFSLNAIGKSLTASFNLSDNKAVAYVDTVLQVSKETRNRFDKPVYYVVTYPGYNILSNVKISDEVWDYGEDVITEIALTEDMLYTNKPSTVGDDLANMLDNDPSTVFHTVYGAAYDASVMPYITITLDSPVDKLKFYYMTRTFGDYNSKALNLYVSEDNMQWTLVRGFTSDADGLPLSPAGAEYTSPIIDLGGSYRYLKLEQTASEYKNNHMVFAEFRLYDVKEGSDEPVKVQDAVYKTMKMPFGNIYTVNVDWLTDKVNSVPRIEINVDGGYLLIHNNKDTYYNASFRIVGNGVYEDFEDSVQIKGRGNSTWSYPKKPYRIKFSEKRKPFGLTNGKNWVLLANYIDGSMMANAIAMKAGQLAEVPYTNHIIPVELYMDGQYRGSYMFTEKVGFGNNSVDIDEDLGVSYMLELDDYYDETYKFRSSGYYLPVNVKEPDLSDFETEVATEKFTAIKESFNAFEASLYTNDTLSKYLDMEACAKFMLVNDLVLNQELGHPKSTYLWREDVTSPSSKIVFGPLWDFDWGFGYEHTSSFCEQSTATLSVMSSKMSTEAGYRFFSALMNNSEFKKYYYKEWKEFLDKGHIKELQEFIDDYYRFAESSFYNNYNLWGDGRDYATAVTNMKNWVKQRHDYILANIEEYDITELLHTLPGDVDCNDFLTVHDIVLAVANKLGDVDADFCFAKADMDKDSVITNDDVVNIMSQVVSADPVSSTYYFNTPLADVILSTEEFEAAIEETVKLPLFVEEYGSNGYYALQMDIKVPAGMLLTDAIAAERASMHNVYLNQLGEDTYRLVVYSDENESFAEGDSNKFVELSVYATEVLPDDECALLLSNVLLVSDEKIEQRVGDLNARFGMTTGISSTAISSVGVRGGDCLTISSLVSQTVKVYAVDGRLVRTLQLEPGTVNVNLPAGIYVVLGQKVIIR